MLIYSIVFRGSYNETFSSKLINIKNRDIPSKNFPNKKRRFHYLSNPVIFYQKKEKNSFFLKVNQVMQIKGYKILIKILAIIYISSFLINFQEILLKSLIINVGDLFEVLGIFVLSFILLLFFSGKKFEKQFLNKISISFIYLNLIMITEKCILFSGSEQTWILFKVFANLIINGNAWIMINTKPSFSFSNENKIFWYIRTSFLSVFLIDILNRLFFMKHLKWNFDEIFNLPHFSLTSFIFLKQTTLVYSMNNFWFFSTIASSFMILTCLSFLYFIAFVKSINEDENMLVSTREFIVKKFPKETVKHNHVEYSPISLSNLKSLDKINPKIIEELMKSEKGEFLFNKKEKTGRWKIKKKGIKTPFSESLWNGELPLLKQNLWYEIKSR